jgi:para-nitrobenzyl esterase
LSDTPNTVLAAQCPEVHTQELVMPKLVRWVWQMCLGLSCGMCCMAAQALTPVGLWYDYHHPGHGLDLHRAGDQWFGTLYTYAADGTPQWLWLQAPFGTSQPTALTRYTREGTQLRATVVGQLSLEPLLGDCASLLPRPDSPQRLRLRFVLDGIARDWCVDPLLPERNVAMSALNGAWYDPADPGWGLFAYFYPGNGTTQTYQTIYYHDASGQPRWAFTQDVAAGFDAQRTWYSLRNECLDCGGLAILATPVGSAQVRLASHQSQPATPNRIALRLAFDGDPDTSFVRTSDLQLLSDPLHIAEGVSTREGVIQGETLSDGTLRYRGVPFAAAPLAQLRWAAPAAAQSRDSVLLTQQFGPGCPQTAGSALFTGAPPGIDEDCLSLNIWAPSMARDLPVMVWIHGGGLTIGSSGQQLNGQSIYDGAALAKQAVVVSINYRLGALGYAALRDFPDSSNLGLRDQIAALSWLQQNIEAFGGDPRRLTIFGESAGAVSVCALLASAPARGLFQRAIMQSGNCRATLPSLEQARQTGDRLLARSNCAQAADRTACLRALGITQVLEAGQASIGFGRPGEEYGLVIDGVLLSQTPQLSIALGEAAQVPLLLGVNDDEMTTLLPTSSLPSSASAYEQRIRETFGPLAEQVLQRYPLDAQTTAQQAWQKLYGDLAFTCANRRAAAEHAARGNAVYHYVLTEIFPDPQLAPLQSFHGADIALLFGPRIQAATGERMLSAQMQRAWVDFAHGVQAQQFAGAHWPRYTAERRASIRLDHTQGGQIDDYRGEYCEFWSQFLTL